MERCESGRIGRFRKPLSRKAPGVRIPLSPIRRRGNIAAGDSKRGPNHLGRRKGPRAAPKGRIPLSPIRRRENIAAGDSKRGPADLGRKKGPKAAPEGRIPLSPIRRRGNIAVGDSKRGPNHLGRRKGPKAAPEGCPSKGYPPLSDMKEREYSCGGFETRSQPPMGGERDRGRPRRGALVRAIPLSPIKRRGDSLLFLFCI